MIAVTAQSPFGEAERTTGRWLPYLWLFDRGRSDRARDRAAAAWRAGRGAERGRARPRAQRHRLHRPRSGVLAGHRRPARVDASARVHGVLPVRAARSLAGLVDLAGPPARRPRRVDLRLRGLRGRPAAVHHPRPAHPAQRQRLTGRGIPAGYLVRIPSGAAAVIPGPPGGLLGDGTTEGGILNDPRSGSRGCTTSTTAGSSVRPAARGPGDRRGRGERDIPDRVAAAGRRSASRRCRGCSAWRATCCVSSSGGTRRQRLTDRISALTSERRPAGVGCRRARGGARRCT